MNRRSFFSNIAMAIATLAIRPAMADQWLPWPATTRHVVGLGRDQFGRVRWLLYSVYKDEEFIGVEEVDLLGDPPVFWSPDKPYNGRTYEAPNQEEDFNNG